MNEKNKQFNVFVERWRKIVQRDTEERFSYFVSLAEWLNDAPRGTAQKLSETLGYNKFWVSNNIRPIRLFGAKKVSRLLFDLGWPYGEVVLLSAAKEDRRDKLLSRAISGEERKKVVGAVFSTFRGTKVANKTARAEFFDSIESASTSQIIKWIIEYLNNAPKKRAIAILKGLAAISMNYMPRKKAA